MGPWETAVETEKGAHLRFTWGETKTGDTGFPYRCPAALLPRPAGRRPPRLSCRRSLGPPGASPLPNGSCPSDRPPCRRWRPGVSGSPIHAPAQSTLCLCPSLSTSMASPKTEEGPSLLSPALPQDDARPIGCPPGQRPARERALGTGNPKHGQKRGVGIIVPLFFKCAMWLCVCIFICLFLQQFYLPNYV